MRRRVSMRFRLGLRAAAPAAAAGVRLYFSVPYLPYIKPYGSVLDAGSLPAYFKSIKLF